MKRGGSMRFDREHVSSGLNRFAAEGMSRREAAARLGISYHTAKHLGRGIKFAIIRTDKKTKAYLFEAGRDARYLKYYGCSYAEFKSCPAGSYKCFCKQKLSAKLRGIDWEFNFHQWWLVWDRSGHWSDRGTTRGCFQMCRYGDDGPYAPDNIYIATLEQNVKDSWANGAHL